MRCTSELPALDPATRRTCQQVAARLALQAPQVATCMTDAVFDEIADYRPFTAPAPRQAVFDHSLDHVRAIVRAIDAWQLPSGAELAFVRDRASLRATQQLPLSALLHSYRIGHRTVWQRLVDLLEGSDQVLEATLALTALTLAYTEVISTVLADGYTERQRHLLLEVDRDRRDLLERILLGTPDRQSETVRLASSFALAPGGDYLVIVLASAREQTTPTGEEASEYGELSIAQARNPSGARPDAFLGPGRGADVESCAADVVRVQRGRAASPWRPAPGVVHFHKRGCAAPTTSGVTCFGNQSVTEESNSRGKLRARLQGRWNGRHSRGAATRHGRVGPVVRRSRSGTRRRRQSVLRSVQFDRRGRQRDSGRELRANGLLDRQGGRSRRGDDDRQRLSSPHERRDDQYAVGRKARRRGHHGGAGSGIRAGEWSAADDTPGVLALDACVEAPVPSRQ